MRYRHLGGYSDWVRPVPSGEVPPVDEVRRRVRALLDVPEHQERPADVRVERRWRRDGVAGEELSWSVGYGPRTHAWLVRPGDREGPLPGVVALHGHDGYTFHGKEKIADGPSPPHPSVSALRSNHYEDRAFANELARAGFAVLVPDTFGWGSRRFPLRDMPPVIQRLAELSRGVVGRVDPPQEDDEVTLYNAAAWHHEHLVAKYCTILGTSLPAVVSAEDRAAATSDAVDAAVVVGMMSTYEALLDHSVVDHTWMFLPPGLSRFADWPDLAAAHAPTPLLVQYNRDDHLFPLAGAEAAHRRIAAHYAGSGGYDGRFYPGPHKFDHAMQRDAFDWLADRLS